MPTDGLFYAEQPRWRLPPAALVPQRTRPGDLGPVGNSLYALGDVLDQIGSRVKTNQDAKKLDDLANSLAKSGQIPGVDPASWQGGGMAEAQFRLASAMGGTLPGGSGKNASGGGRINAPHISRAVPAGGGHMTPGQAAVQNRFEQRRNDAQDKQAEAVLSKALTGMKPDTAEAVAQAIPGGLTQEELDARTGQEPGSGSDVKFNVPSGGTDYHVADNLKALVGYWGGGKSFVPPSPGSRSVSVPASDLGSYLDRRNAVEGGTPMLANPKGGFVAADKYLQALAQSNPQIREALARDAQIRARGLSDNTGNPTAGAPPPGGGAQQLSDDGTEPMPTNAMPLFAQPQGEQPQQPANEPDAGAIATQIKARFRAGEITEDEAVKQLSSLNL